MSLERNESSHKDKDFQYAGEQIRVQALGSAQNSNALVVPAACDDVLDTPPRQHTQRQFTDSDGEQSEWIRSHLKAYSTAEANCSQIEEWGLKPEKTQNEQCPPVEEIQANLAGGRLDLDGRRLTEDEERLALKPEEKRSSMEELKQVITLLSALAKKLR